MEKEQIRKKAQQMFEKGKSYSEISQKFNISESTLKSWKKTGWVATCTPPKKRSATPRKNKKVATPKVAVNRRLIKGSSLLEVFPFKRVKSVNRRLIKGKRHVTKHAF